MLLKSNNFYGSFLAILMFCVQFKNSYKLLYFVIVFD